MNSVVIQFVINCVIMIASFITALCQYNNKKDKRQSGIEYYGAAEPPVRCGESHLSGLTEPLRSL